MQLLRRQSQAGLLRWSNRCAGACIYRVVGARMRCCSLLLIVLLIVPQQVAALLTCHLCCCHAVQTVCKPAPETLAWRPGSDTWDPANPCQSVKTDIGGGALLAPVQQTEHHGLQCVAVETACCCRAMSSLVVVCLPSVHFGTQRCSWWSRLKMAARPNTSQVGWMVHKQCLSKACAACQVLHRCPLLPALGTA
jgi:hypothetical protein